MLYVLCQAAEQQEWQLDRVDDYLVPYLVNLGFPETLSSTDFENVVASCLQEFKERRTTVVNLIKEHQKKVEQQEASMKHEHHRSSTLFSAVFVLLSL